MIVIVGALSFLTFKRNAEWKDNNTLYLSAQGVEGSVLLVNEGNIFANSKKYDEAEVFYKKAIDLRDNNLLAHHNMGLIYLLRGNLDSAKIKFKKGISIDSLAPDGYFQLATLYNLQNKKDSAVIMLEKLQTITPNYRESENILKSLKEGGDTDPNLLPKGFENDETRNYQIDMLQKRSYKYFTEKNYPEAINDLNKLIELNTDASTISGFMNNIAMCYAEMNKPDLEEKYFLDAVRKDPKNLNAVNGLSAFYLKTGNNEKAKEYLKLMQSANPGDENSKKKLDSLNKIK
jgi:tetratricopeptide (TPR) repeat protein